MRWVIRFAALSLTLATAGCLGGYQPGTPGTHTDPVPDPNQNQNTGSTTNTGNTGNTGTNVTGTGNKSARELFDTSVEVILTSCSACHAGTGTVGGPKFLGATGDAWYASLVADARFVNNVPEKSYLITHVHAPGEGPDLNQAQDNTVIAWIAQENVERALPPPPAPANVAAQELAKFGACMTLTDFNNSGMRDLQNQNTTLGPCTSCHQTGNYVYLSNNATDNFNRLKQSPWIIKFASGALNADGTFKDIVATNRFKDRGTEPGHPQYTLAATRAQALQTFFKNTYDRYKAGNCTPAPSPSPSPSPSP